MCENISIYADLFAYFLTGRKACEYSIASTSQMLDARTRDWSDALLEKIGISREILPEIVEPGTVLGELTDEIVEETGMKKSSCDRRWMS